jgi:hypothetical protein
VGLVDAYTNDAITITPRGSLQGDGTYDLSGTAVSTRARVVVKSGVRKDADGKEWMYRFKVYLRAGESIALQDQITFGGSTYRVREVEERDGLDGNLDHYVVYCG